MRGLLPLLLVSPAFGQFPKIGDAAPALVLEQTLPADAAANWPALRGRPVVIEFWGTWCGNCVAEIPHLNALAAKFPDVQFLSITDEPASVVEPFLAKYPISGWIGLDRNGATLRAYGVEARPRTFFIDRDGVVRAAMHPAQVSEATLADLAAGRPVQPAALFSRPKILTEAGDDPAFAVMLRPSRNPKPGGVFNVDAGRLHGDNIFFRAILAYAYNVRQRLLHGPEALLNTRYDFCVVLPEGVPGDRQLLRDMLDRSFKLKIRRDPRTEDAVVLKPVGPPPPSGGYGRMMMFAIRLEALFNRAFVDESGIESFPLFEPPETREELVQALRSRLGLEVVFEKRAIDHLIIESMELPTYRVR